MKNINHMDGSGLVDWAREKIEYCTQDILTFLVCDLKYSLLSIPLLICTFGLALPLVGIFFAALKYTALVKAIKYIVRIFKEGGFRGGGQYDMLDFITIVTKTYEDSKSVKPRKLGDRALTGLLKSVIKLNLRTRHLSHIEKHIIANEKGELSQSLVNKFESKLNEIKSDKSLDRTHKKLKRLRLVLRIGKESNPAKFQKLSNNIFKKTSKNVDKLEIKNEFREYKEKAQNNELTKSDKFKIVRKLKKIIKETSKLFKHKPIDETKLLE